MMADKRHQTINLLAAAMEYAANYIDANSRRGVFVRAFVEGEEWAEQDLLRHLEALEADKSAPQRDSNSEA